MACDADALPDEEQPNAKDFEFKEGPLPPRDGASVPGHPIDEEENVPRLVLHHGLERVDQTYGKEVGALGHIEQSEGEEGVDALAEARHHESPFRILRRDVLRFRCELDAIG